MEIKTAEFIISNTDYTKCPEPKMPEYAFIGRSNVGKSSLINMLTNHKKLAKVSGQPGKTQTINHFVINNAWYLVDLPGFGYAKVSKKSREQWLGFVRKYILNRENLYCIFVLVDVRIKPQKNDLDFIRWLGENQIPLGIIYTKADKLKSNELKKSLALYEKVLGEEWEELPPSFITSSTTGRGKLELLEYIDSINQSVEE